MKERIDESVDKSAGIQVWCYFGSEAGRRKCYFRSIVTISQGQMKGMERGRRGGGMIGGG